MILCLFSTNHNEAITSIMTTCSHHSFFFNFCAVPKIKLLRNCFRLRYKLIAGIVTQSSGMSSPVTNPLLVPSTSSPGTPPARVVYLGSANNLFGTASSCSRCEKGQNGNKHLITDLRFAPNEGRSRPKNRLVKLSKQYVRENHN